MAKHLSFNRWTNNSLTKYNEENILKKKIIIIITDTQWLCQTILQSYFIYRLI